MAWNPTTGQWDNGSFNAGSMQNWSQSPSISNLTNASSGSVYTPNINAGTPQIGSGLGVNLNQPSQYTGTNVNSIGAQQSGGFMDSFAGSTDAGGNFQQGWGMTAAQGIGTLANSWLGFQNLGLAKDQFNFQKDAWQEQFAIQKEEYEYQKQRRQERMDNYNASQGNQSSASAAAASPNSL